MRTVAAPEAVEAVARPALLRPLVVIAHVLALAVLVQAALAGRWFVDPDVIRLHGYIGNLSFLLGIVQVALVALIGFRGRQRSALLGTSVLLALLMTAQIGLGYAGRERTAAIAWHVPLGVLIFGLITANISLVLRARREKAGV